MPEAPSVRPWRRAAGGAAAATVRSVWCQPPESYNSSWIWWRPGRGGSSPCWFSGLLSAALNLPVWRSQSGPRSSAGLLIAGLPPGERPDTSGPRVRAILRPWRRPPSQRRLFAGSGHLADEARHRNALDKIWPEVSLDRAADEMPDLQRDRVIEPHPVPDHAISSGVVCSRRRLGPASDPGSGKSLQCRPG